MDHHHIIQPSERLTLETIDKIVRQGLSLKLGESAIAKISTCREFLDSASFSGEHPVYGINTGFGSLCDTRIEQEELELLQRNLLLSHACGMGDLVPEHVVRLMLLLKIQGLSYGHSGVQLITVQRLIDFYNLHITPVVYQLGSLGASGDLAPLANMSLPLIGEGEVFYKGHKVKAMDALEGEKLAPISLKSKEGLALINGTQFMSAYAVDALLEAGKILAQSTNIAALSSDAFDVRPEPFSVLIQQVRAHNGQTRIAHEINQLRAGSAILMSEKPHVQDPYSFRCIPQVHGATYDTWKYVCSVVEVEINSVTDNPIIFPEDNKIISGGNFHGQPLALIFDFLAIALAELGSISERRLYKLISGQRGLPTYLTSDAGVNSGFMIAQYTAASIVSQNKQLCTPASVDTIDSSNGQEDHVSMGANAATKLNRLVSNVQRLLGIELLAAAQALDFKRPLRSSDSLEHLHASFRKEVPFFDHDVQLGVWMNKSTDYLSQWQISFIGD